MDQQLVPAAPADLTSAEFHLAFENLRLPAAHGLVSQRFLVIPSALEGVSQLLPNGLPGIPNLNIDVEQLMISDCHLYHKPAEKMVPGSDFATVFARRAAEFAAGERGISIIGGTQFAPAPEVETALREFFTELFDQFQKRDIGIANGGGKGPAMHWTSEIYRSVRSERNPDSNGKVCQVLCEIEPPNGFGDPDYVVRPQRNITSRYLVVKALGPWAVLATPGRVGTTSEIDATLMDNACKRLHEGPGAAITPIVLLGYGPDSQNKWWDWIDEMFQQMDQNIGGAKQKYTISDTVHYVDFSNTKQAVADILALIEGQGGPPRKFSN